MDIYSYLKKDHKKVATLMEEVIVTKSQQEREALFGQIYEELMLHAETEEMTFYQAIEKATRSKNVQEKMGHAHEEHDEIREYLEKLGSMPVGGEEWMELFGEFKHAVTHHVDEEENEVFEKARKYLSSEEARELAREMEQLKKERLSQKSAA